MDDMETNSMVRSYSDELDSLIRSTALDTDVQIDTAAFGIGALAPFFLPYLGCDVKSLQAHYGSWVCSVMAARYPQFVQPLSPSLSTDRIKIGIVSHYFYNHSNLKAPIRGWLEQLDRQLFSVHCFHTGEFIDMATETARSISDTFLQSSDIELVATAIREQCIDVLIYPGIGMDTVTLKLAALRLVPVQCSSWGHPVTTGMPTIDYFISSDLMEPPDGDEHYTEKLIRLPHLSIWYEPTEPQQNSFPEFVIPGCEKHDFIYLCSQNLLKYLPRYDFVFPAIAREVENARFVFIASHIGELNDKFLRRLDLAFSTMGLNVNDHVSIILQLDEVGFSTLNSKADIFLDTIEWSGCNTVFESLPFNKPIVTLPGKFMRSRHTYAILKMMNIEDTIASNVDDYISISVRLANDIEYRRDVSARLCRNKHKIYRDRKCIDALERFLVDATGYGKPRELYE
jgi:predicted O-linked N-acetylglucosamine transferase (SPINDLY family)